MVVTGILIDSLIVLTMMLFVFIGYKRGLIKLGIRLFALIIAIFLAVILYKPIAGIIMNKTRVDENISDSIYYKIQDKDLSSLSEEDKKQNKLLFLGEDYINQAIEEKRGDATRFVADSLSVTIVETSTFISLFIALRIVLIVLNLLADVIGSIPIIKQFNHTGGVLVGFIEGIVIINVLFAFLYLINPFVANGNIGNALDQTFMGKIMFENNIIVNKIAK